MNIISLGAGVQSSTMALMASKGLITPMPFCAIFADTGWESKETYKWLEWLVIQLEFPVHIVSNGNIYVEQLANHEKRTTMPFRLNDGVTKSRALQKCTHDYKTVPNERMMKKILRENGYSEHRLPTYPVITQWRGITTDEAHRMKPASEKWYQTRYPLAMELGWQRGQCIKWMNDNGYPTPPRSSCIGCPNHGNDEWRIIKTQRPDEWKQAVSFDKTIRKSGGLHMPAFLHSDGVPLDEADLSEDKNLELFGNECEGMCGL